MDGTLDLPAGWRMSVHPDYWPEAFDRVSLPPLRRVGHVLLPEFFILVIGTEGMWSESDHPKDDDFAIFLTFHVFEEVLYLSSIRGSSVDATEGYAKVAEHIPPDQWKALGVLKITEYLAEFTNTGKWIDGHGERLPHGYPRYYWNKTPTAAVRWLAQLRSPDAPLLADDPHAPTLHAGRRNRITDDLLREVADIYNNANEIGAAPTRAVAEHFQKSHSTAAKWVGSARRKGFLEASYGVGLAPEIIEAAENSQEE